MRQVQDRYNGCEAGMRQVNGVLGGYKTGKRDMRWV